MAGTPATVQHDWIDYTGCDSLYSVAADSFAVYTGGHQRWADSPIQCDGNGNGTKVDSPGMSGLTLAGVITSAGLWIASDNAQTVDACGKTSTGGVGAGTRNSASCLTETVRSTSLQGDVSQASGLPARQPAGLFSSSIGASGWGH